MRADGIDKGPQDQRYLGFDLAVDRLNLVAELRPRDIASPQGFKMKPVGGGRPSERRHAADYGFRARGHPAQSWR